MKYEDVGFTLLIDAAYHVYAKEPHGWAETLTDALHDGMEWPANLLLTFAVRYPNPTQYTDYEVGLWSVFTQMNRVVERITTVMGVTGRQTWSASSRLAQYSIAKIHSNSKSGAAWSDEKLRLTMILQERRDLFISTCEKLEVQLIPHMMDFSLGSSTIIQPRLSNLVRKSKYILFP